MKWMLIFIMAAGSLFAEWESAYGSGDILRPNVQMDYNRQFQKSAEEKSFYDESMRNRMTPVMVEVEDNMAPNRGENDNFKKHTDDFFYSSNKRDYYGKEAKGSKALIPLD